MRLCDVTLREGEQLPGRSYSVEQKLEAAQVLDELGVPFIQAGFPVTGESDRRVTRTLASSLDAAVVGIARAIPGDVDAALQAEADVVEVFAPLSTLQLTHVLDRPREDVFEAIREAVDQASAGGAAVHLCIVDAFRTEQRHLVDAIERFDDVEYLNLADTVGIRTPTSVRSFLEDLCDASGVAPGRLGVHFHDDLGVATATAMSAYEIGVGRVDVSVASFGERAGNASLEEVVAIADLEYDDPLGVDRSRLIPSCQTVLEGLGEAVQPRKALLGEEVVEHESGLHTAAMLDEPSVFEPFDPARFGGERRLVFGAGTGRGAARKLLARAGIEPDDETVQAFLERLAADGPMGTDEAVSLAERAFGS